jgi:prolyl oligopeptidase
MRLLIKTIVIIFCLLLALFCISCPGKTVLKYPVTKKADQVDDYFGTKVKDPYRWLEDINSSETGKWLELQEKIREQYFSRIGFREKFKVRLTALANFERYYAPAKEGEFYVSWKNNGLQEQYVLCIQKGLTGKPEVLLDPNTFSKDSSVYLVSISFSKDQRYLGYGISRGGSDWTEYYVMEVQTREKLADHIQWTKSYGISWYKDGFFYSRFDEPENSEKLKAKNEFMKVYYHKLGRKQSADQLIYQDTGNPRLRFPVQVTDDEKYLVIDGRENMGSQNFLYYKDLGTNSSVLPLCDKLQGHFEFIDEIDDYFLVTTDLAAPYKKLILMDPKNPQKDHWKEVIPESANKMESVACVGGRLIVSYLKDAYTAAAVFNLEGKKLHDIQLPGIGAAYGFSGKKEDNEVFFTFESFTIPSTIYRYHIRENKSELFRESLIKFDPDKYETRQVFYESKDKTKIPMFIVCKKGLELDGKNPALLYGYGGFNFSMTPYFWYGWIPWLENGGIYAQACLRGGGEYGEEWHRAGMLEKKQNVFDDFIAAAEYLIASGYTSPQRLAINGGSNGGLLVGAVVTQRPDLFAAAVPDAGPYDMLRTQKFTLGGLVASEYGSSDDPGQFDYLYKYSPLHNIHEDRSYPAILVTTGDHDDRVFPAHSYKFVATLQEKYKGKNPVLLRVDKNVGHGVSNLSTSIEYYSDILSFMLYNCGIFNIN